MDRRLFLGALGAALAAPAALAARPVNARRLRRVGVQLYSLRDAARKDLERTLTDIAAVGYHEVEMLGSMNNFGMPPAQIRQVLDRVGLKATSTHVGGAALDDLPRTLGEAATLGHEHVIIASLPGADMKTLDGYRRWADRLNTAAAEARKSNVWLGFHNHAGDFATIDGQVAYDVFIERTDPALVRHQLDTGNLAMAGRDPLVYLKKYGNRYWSFHVKDVAEMNAKHDAELGTGIMKFKEMLKRIDRIDEKHLFVEQETYPTGDALESVKKDFRYISTLEF
jgi:sugar phosphate isomerase/epimerase